MTEISHIITYFFMFASLYFEVFVLVTYFEKRDKIKKETLDFKKEPDRFPTVSIIVPAFNEENTILKTIESLLRLDYPKDRFEILVVDDGSKDKTWDVLQKFKETNQVKIFQKENGGKHTALNFALEKSQSELVGCLDADSFVQEDALKNIVNYFLADSSAMAVTPSVRIYKPNNVLQLIQKVEYGLGILFRKILSYLGAMYVTPGPFSIFKREVFLKIGPYRYAHQTEDMELAMRMQKNKMKILNSHNAVVWTVAPNTLKKLYKQRVRWTYGFIKNASDYRFIFFNREYGNLGLLILPMAAISIISVTFMVGRTIYSFLESFSNEIIKIQTVGIHLSLPDFTFSWFSFNTEFIALASAVTALGSIVMILVSRKITEGRVRMGMDLIYFFTLYIFIAPLWLTKALLNAVFSIKTTWR